jgi:hypothetical protein
MRSYYKNGFAKHYVRDHDVLRIEAATNNVYQDYHINKAVENLSSSARENARHHHTLPGSAAGHSRNFC